MGLLKLDDLARHGAGPGATVSPQRQRVTDFLESGGIKPSFGVFGESLEGDVPAYVSWLKTRVDRGWIELWHHGWFAWELPLERKVNGRTAEYL